jgi:hypothetical protein
MPSPFMNAPMKNFNVAISQKNMLARVYLTGDCLIDRSGSDDHDNVGY